MQKRLWIVGGLVLMAGVVAVLFLLPSRGQEHPATVVEAVNKVDAHPRPKDDWGPAAVGMAIYGSGQVRTGAASSARLELLKGLVRLSAESLFTVKESATRQGKLVTTLFLQEGRLWAHLTSDQPHEFTVETGSAVAAVRDTRFSVGVDPDQTTRVSVAEGEVVVTAQGVSVTVVAGQQATVEPGQPPSPPEPMSEEERDLWASEGEMEPKIVFPENGQMIWGTINVLVVLPGVEVSEVVFAYDGGEGFVDFAVDDGTVVDSDFVREDRFGTWDTSGLPTGDYTLQARAEGADGQIVIPEVTVTVVDEPQVDIEWSVIASSEEVTRVLLSASESSNPDLYQLGYTWVFADGSTSEGASVEREFASHPVCHQPILDDYEMLYELAPEEMTELEPLVEEIMAGPCVEPVVLSYTHPGGTWGEETILVSIGPDQTAKVASVSARLVLALAVDVSKDYAGDAKRIDELNRETERIAAILKKAYTKAKEEEKFDLFLTQVLVLSARTDLRGAKASLKLGRLGRAINQVAEARKNLRRASEFIRSNNIDAVKGEADKLDLASAGASAAWGRLRLVELIGDEAKTVTSPAVATKCEYKGGGVWVECKGSQYAQGSRHSKVYCTQFLVIQSSDRHDDDVILHEFGHHTMYKAMKVNLPGGNHSLKTKCTEKLAWSEGWGNFLQAVLQGKGTYKDVETGGDLKYNLEKDPKGYAQKGPDEEGSVSAILWDLYDGTDGVKDEDKDGVSIEFKYIWEAMKESKNATDVGTLKRFYKELIKIIDANEKLKKDINKDKIKAIFQEHNVNVVAPPAPGPTITPTPTPEKEEVAPPAPTAKDYVEECNALLVRGKSLLEVHDQTGEGDCKLAIELAQSAIDKATAALELDPDNVYACLCRAKSHIVLGGPYLKDTIPDLECAAEGLEEGNDKNEARRELETLRQSLAEPPTVSMSHFTCAEGWDWESGAAFNQSTTFSGCPKEIWCRREQKNTNKEVALVQWLKDYELVCQHYTDELEGSYDGSGWTTDPDEDCIPPGTYHVEAWIGPWKMAEVSFNVTDQEVAPPTSAPPTILSIDFPSRIPPDGTGIDGSVRFRDPDGDVNWVTFDVVSASDFESFAFNPVNYLIEGDATEGVFSFHTWSNVVQQVTLRVTLYDDAGNSSAPVDFSFTSE